MVFSILSFNNCVQLQIAIQGGIYSCYNFKITKLSKYKTMYNYVIKKWQIHSDKKYWALPAFEFATFRSRKIWNNSLTDRAKKSLRFFLFAVLQNERQVYHKLCIRLWLRYSSWEFVACSLDECRRGGGWRPWGIKRYVKGNITMCKQLRLYQNIILGGFYVKRFPLRNP